MLLLCLDLLYTIQIANREIMFHLESRELNDIYIYDIYMITRYYKKLKHVKNLHRFNTLLSIKG